MINELDQRREKAKNKMEQHGIDAALVFGNMNLYYLCGEIFDGCLYLPLDGEPVEFRLRGNIKSVKQIPDMLNKPPKRVMIDDGDITGAEWARLCGVFDASECVGASDILREIRSVKTSYEIEIMKKGARIQAEVYKIYPTLYRPGMTDTEFSIELEHVSRLHGHLGIFRMYGSRMEIFMGSVLSGDNAAVPSPYDFALGGQGRAELPVGSCGDVMREGSSVMVDIGGNYTGYLTDLTRTYSIGKLIDKAYFAHNVSLEIQSELSRTAVPGAVCGELYDLACNIAAKHKLDDCFMGLSQQAKFVGHGVGLCINELPIISRGNKAQLEYGNMIALEPKFVIAGVGAVGTENTYLVTESGMEKLTICDENILDLLCL